jgi:hypothetical protein
MIGETAISNACDAVSLDRTYRSLIRAWRMYVVLSGVGWLANYLEAKKMPHSRRVLEKDVRASGAMTS